MDCGNPALKEGRRRFCSVIPGESPLSPYRSFPPPFYRPSRPPPIHAIISPKLTGPRAIAIAITGLYIIPGRGLCRRDFYGIAETAG